MKRILVVDDQEQNRYYLEALLTASDYTVETATDGADALRKAHQALPDLVITDLLMPVMDGYSLIRNWRADSSFQSIPLIVYTATYTDPEDEELALALGADAFLVKPVEPDILLVHIARALALDDATRRPGQLPLNEQDRLLERHSEVLLHKLEKKMLELEETNRALRTEMEARRRLSETQRSVLDALPAQIALLDPDGVIQAVNEAWLEFGRNNGLGDERGYVGKSYLDACDGADETSATGIRRVLAGEASQYSLEYPCHGPKGRRWYLMLVTPLASQPVTGAAVMHIDITDRKRTEEALRVSEKELRGMAEAMPQMVWTTSPDGSDAYLNRRWLDYTGTLTEEAASGGWVKSFHADDQAAAADAWLSALAKAEAYSFEGRLRRVDGTYRWMLVRGVPLRDDAGTIIKWIGTCTDIDDLKRATEQLAQNTYLLRLAGRIARVGGWAITAPDGVASWSDEVFDILGFPIDQGMPTNQQTTDLFNGASGGDVWNAIAECMSEGTPFDLELEMKSAQGQPIWLRLVAEAVRNSTGEIIRVQGAIQDISSSKHATEAARQSMERFRLLSLATKDAIWDLDYASGNIWWSEGFEELTGNRQGETQRPIAALTEGIHPEDRQRVVSRIRALVAGNDSSWSDAYRIRRSDGSYAQVVDRGFLIRDSQGKVVRMVGGITDISDRMQLEEQLRQSQRLESLGQLTGGVAHDFNNLLGIIYGNLELVSEELRDRPELQEMLQSALNASERGATLTRSLLAFSRQQPLDPHAIDPSTLIEDMISLLRRTVPENIEIRFVPNGTWKCEADSGQLQNALLNLVVNARHAMPDGGRLTLETGNARLDEDYSAAHAEVRPGEYVVIAVSDTGTGMSPEVIARAFEPFFTTKEVGKGTGLGLSMVYGFAKQSLGHVNIYSELGEGTTVRLYLPRSGGTGVDRAKAVPHSSQGSEIILLVEDDADMARMTSRLLRSLGYRVMTAARAEPALEIVQRGTPFDLLLTDVVLPGSMNGRALADEVERQRPGTRVVFMSGYTENAILHHGRLDEGVHLLQKPFLKRELAAKLRDVLDEESPRGHQ
ncbi:MAG TPA: PAS domain-containing protein [Alphaproteobacteria bacterium]|jgi:PAS domain S-box-containing protein|nr:PAS domain-containing protein [Alphaproteobacteria bacterium]